MLKRLLGSAICAAQLLWAVSSKAADNSTNAMQQSLEKQRGSLNKQVDSLRQQSASLPPLDQDPFFSAAPSVAAEFDCSPLPRPDVDSLIQHAANKNSLDAGLLRAVMKQESAFHPCAISAKGAQGLMQLMPSTAEQFHVTDPFDPEQNVQAGAAFLRQLLGKYKGDLKSSLVAYNAGANRAGRTDLPIPAETQSYLANIFADLGMQRVESSVTQQQKSEASKEESDSNASPEQTEPQPPDHSLL